ncbi:MAG: S-layer homology domain-containing protein, partial [Oscillospiraceae bacterium]|nr:S-layer homology domain-containing protein [Oscillospiraceae bacterium]
NTAVHKLSGIGSLVLAAGAAYMPHEQSDLTGANVTVPATAKLDLSSMGDVTIGDFTGGGTLALASGQMLTITGAVNGTTAVVVPAADTGITAGKSGECSFALAEGSGVDSFERDEYGSWTAGLFAYPVKTFSLSGVAVQAGDTSAQLPAEVTFDDEAAAWEFDIPLIDFTITVNDNPALYDDEAYAYVDEVTSFAVYPSAEDEYFVVDFPEGGAAAGKYEISVTVPAESTVDDVALTATVTLTVTGGEPTPVEPDITEPVPCFQTYDGTAQELIEEGTTSLGTMLYSTDGENWNAGIPTATNAGDYEVYWKVDGGEDFEDIVCEEPVEASIYKKDLTITPKSYLLKVGDTVPNLTEEGAYTIEGFVLSDTAETVIEGSITLSFNETPDMSKPGHYSIYVNGRETDDKLTADNYDISTPFGALEVVECIHSFTDFTLGTVNTENDSVFARCAEGCAEYAELAPVLTIEAPKDAVYEEGLYHNAAIFYDSQLTPEPHSEKISCSAEPVDAGTYTAYYICHDVEAYVTYEIAKRPLTIKAVDKSIYAGDSAPAYTYTVTGWEENHDEGCLHQLTGISAVCTGDVTKAGTYDITFSGTPKVLDSDGGDDSENYTFTMQNGTLTVKNRSTGGGGGGYTGPVVIPGKQPEQPKDEPKEEQKPAPSVTFTDVPSGAYYTEAVDWAVEKGITNGMGGGSFAPESPCTRGQMVLFLYRMAGEPATNGVVNFKDVSARDYYARAIAWAVENGITTGMGDGRFAPDAECSRAQMAVFLYRMVGAAVEGGHTFGDVDADAYYADAVAWAAASGITTGTGGGAFSPNANCTRGQMVTFLFRCFAE